MYKYSHNSTTDILTENETISLHDCHAEHMSLENGMLSFHFPDGFQVGQDNGVHQTLYYTGESQVDFPLLYPANSAVTIYVFEENSDITIRTEHTAEDFMRLLNSDGYSLEFLYSYTGTQTFRFDCWLWSDQEPYHRECELIISAENAVYQWNEMYASES